MALADRYRIAFLPDGSMNADGTLPEVVSTFVTATGEIRDDGVLVYRSDDGLVVGIRQEGDLVTVDGYNWPNREGELAGRIPHTEEWPDAGQ
jgi:hypothetical protein